MTWINALIEYVFLVDRSGSMEGGRIEAVKAALQILLRSLPTRKTTFNIISFGSSFSPLWQKSQVYGTDTVEEASKHIDTMEADLGGTEIRDALDFAFKKRNTAEVNGDKPATSVFVLTDGEAWDIDQ